MSLSRYLAVCGPLSAAHRGSLAGHAHGGGRHRGTRATVGVIFVACFAFNVPRFFEQRVESHGCRLGPGGAPLTVRISTTSR